eukprot:6177955-Pleurochrysis_carterae.AAC.6
MCRHQGEHQPSVYHRGLPVPGMPVVTHWRRPSEFCEKPTLFTNDWEAEGVMQVRRSANTGLHTRTCACLR